MRTDEGDAADGAGEPNRYEKRRARTREQLLRAARVVFERDGFHAARLSDVAAEAKVSTGTFYNYFDSKSDLFKDLMATVEQDLVEHSEDRAPSSDPIAGIESSNRAYVRGYRRNARLMSLLLQIAEQDNELLERRLAFRQRFEDRLSHAIMRWQREGLVYDDLDPVYTANALAYMVDRFCYEWTILDLDYDEDRVVETLTKVWTRSLGLERPA
ncbi:MAG: TetR/AcrR family transcriptional regulator [Ilumatobacteraceae bacterium]